jgi:hypothetical protein
LGISRPIPKLPGPISSILWYSHPRGYPRVSSRGRERERRDSGDGSRWRRGKETAAGK